jgi:hypothetical protein
VGLTAPPLKNPVVSKSKVLRLRPIKSYNAKDDNDGDVDDNDDDVCTYSNAGSCSSPVTCCTKAFVILVKKGQSRNDALVWSIVQFVMFSQLSVKHSLIASVV